MGHGNSAVASAASRVVLTSWKEIAQYLGKGVRTVQRWEQDFGLPVRRPAGTNKKAILARTADLDAWVALRCSSRSELLMPATLGYQLADDSPSGDGLGSGNGLHSGDGSPSSNSHTSAGLPPFRIKLGILSALDNRIATSRMLRASNRLLLDEVRSALDGLQREVIALSQNG